MATTYQQPYTNYGPNPGRSGSDPRGRTQNQSQYQQQRFESQQGPLMGQAALNYGRASEADYGNYTDIMNMYRDIASGNDGAGGGGGGGNYGVGQYTPFTVSYSDPFASYGGFSEFSQTGGYSPQDIANMRARGVGPVRAAYANANREIGRQRSLQGGYSPNAIAAQVKMAREQGQSTADAVQNVEAGLAQARNQGRLAGLTGMSGIEGQRLGAQIDVGKFNATQEAEAQARNIAAQQMASSAAASGGAANRAARLEALSGMRSLYGTTPGMANTFGDQAISLSGQGGNFGLGLYGQDINSQRLPGAFDTTMGRIGTVGNMVGSGMTILDDYLRSRRNSGGGSGGTGNSIYGYAGG